ncbi:hypothetical protein CHU32_11360 [Superficieibacter electus]|uniref:Uncharacterized protein n=1 Tax=Superficieibacter electus TaxID=2022662 RepID=A0A2P5GQ65_9ENTR|nr:hypothetical protein CHU33_08430 [Superficieibacter electus]POP48711.1 hypothetical protein CHU32_11360 [Superficieibacter electus]
MKEVTYLEWLKQLPKCDNLYSSSCCPVCNCKGLSYQYMGFNDKDIGWKIVWCESCGSGIKISRTKIPSGANVLIEDKQQEAFFVAHSNLNLIL